MNNTPNSPKIMLHRDLHNVFLMEKRCFQEYPYSYLELVKLYESSDVIGYIINRDNYGEEPTSIIAYCLVLCLPEDFEILTFAVYPGDRRKGYGTILLDHLKTRLKDPKERISAVLREKNLPAQLFFTKNDFKYLTTIYKLYETCEDDAYLFEYKG